MGNRAAIAQNDAAIGPMKAAITRKITAIGAEDRAKHVKTVTISVEKATNARKIGAITPKIRRFPRI